MELCLKWVDHSLVIGRPMNPESQTLTWRAFEDLTSNAEAACASASCTFSLSTLEVAAVDRAPGFAITERKLPQSWRWAIISAGGAVLGEGLEATQSEAKRAASRALEFLATEVA